MFIFNLLRFSDEGTASTVDASASESVVADTGSADTGTESVESEPSFDELIKGKYKDDYNASVQKVIKRRFKNKDSLERRDKAIAPLMQMAAKKYGIDASNMTDDLFDEIVGKMMDEDSYYEDEAFDRGMDVATLKQLKGIERENAELKAFQEQTIADTQNRMRFDDLNAQAEILKRTYPGFDLDTEMQNPQFEKLTWQEGMDLRTVFEVIHHNELQGYMAQVVANETSKKISNAIQSGTYRPREGGNTGQAASVGQISPRDFTKAQRQDIRDRVRRGERVVL